MARRRISLLLCAAERDGSGARADFPLPMIRAKSRLTWLDDRFRSGRSSTNPSTARLKAERLSPRRSADLSSAQESASLWAFAARFPKRSRCFRGTCGFATDCSIDRLE
jgi:hypothetical protein